MAFSFDTSKISQAAARKVTLHDNCTVLDVGTGSFPRDIEVRLPDDDGARQIAIWDGGLDLAVNDEVLCNEYSGNPKWRVVAAGGADSGAGKTRVNKVWASDFTSESLVTDATDNVTINTGTLTLPSDIIHLGDADNKISFTDDAQTFTVGGEVLLTLTEAAQDVVKIGDDGDVDIDFNGMGFLDGATGNWGFGTATPGTDRVAFQGDSGANLAVGFYTGDGDGTDFVSLVMYGVGTPGSIANRERLLLQYDRINGIFKVATEADGTGTLRPLVFETEGNSNQLYIDTVGNVGLSVVPSTRLDIDAGAIEFAEMTAPGAGAANSARLYAVDNGAGKTQLVVIFNTGAAQVIATQP